LSHGFPVKDASDLFPADPLFLVETGKFPDGWHNPLTGALCCPDRLYQRPVLIVFTANFFVMPAEIHAGTLSEISTTVARPFSALHWVFREENLKSLDFMWKFPMFFLTTESNCGRWVNR